MSLTYNSYRKPLEIETDSKKIVFKNISIDYEDMQQNYFDFGFNKEINKHLVYATYYELDEFLLIDYHTSQIDTLNGKPYFSPDLQKIFNFYINPYEEIEINGEYPSFVSEVEIYVVCKGKVKNILRQSFDFIPVAIKWKDNDTVLIKSISSLNYHQIMSGRKKSIKNTEEFKYMKLLINKQ